MHPHVSERIHPRLEDRRDRLVALQVHAANLARPVVDVEVARELRVLRLQLHDGRVCVVRFHVLLRSEEPLFLAAPQADAYCAAQLDAAGLEDAHRFHHHGGSGRVVGRAGAAVPRIEMTIITTSSALSDPGSSAITLKALRSWS